MKAASLDFGRLSIYGYSMIWFENMDFNPRFPEYAKCQPTENAMRHWLGCSTWNVEHMGKVGSDGADKSDGAEG